MQTRIIGWPFSREVATPLECRELLDAEAEPIKIDGSQVGEEVSVVLRPGANLGCNRILVIGMIPRILTGEEQLAANPEHPRHFGQGGPLIEFVKHAPAHHEIEHGIGKAQCFRVILAHLDDLAGISPTQCLDHERIDVHAMNLEAQAQVGGHKAAEADTDIQNTLTCVRIQSRKVPGEDFLLWRGVTPIYRSVVSGDGSPIVDSVPVYVFACHHLT
jgi:hypothetical protein